MPKPILQALVLADHVYKDALTGKMIIAGTFNQVFFTQPSTEAEQSDKNVENIEQAGARKMNWHEVVKAGSPFAYISLTNVRGEVPLELRYVDLDDNLAIICSQFCVRASSPLDTVEAVIQLPPLPTPHAGIYALELLADNEPLGSHRVTVQEMPTPNQENRNSEK